ncbi:MAG: bile acid:sodium symporter family protein [Candidatus Methylacidiphilales bacterium]|nr:bile acid:sodium symporter family protein [Candidatus Methylacidiphilales bacterium]
MTTRLFTLLANTFPLWVTTGGILALVHPEWFRWFSEWKPAGQSLVVWGLGIIMLGMGITLSVEDFKQVVRMPKNIGIGVAAQYLIMPFLGWAVAHLMHLPVPFAVGLILVACCPGGTASNVVTYLARANVALSVLMTMCSTFLAVILTPLLTRMLAGTYVPVDAAGLFWSTVQVVLLPLVLGLLLNHFTPRAVRWVTPVAPLVAVLTITLICASIIAASADAVKSSGPALLLSVFLLHAGGFALGYLFSRIFGGHVTTHRTISIEVGMQNSGLGVVLARQHFADPLTAVPCAISSVFHSVIGSLLAGIWRFRTPR